MYPFLGRGEDDFLDGGDADWGRCAYYGCDFFIYCGQAGVTERGEAAGYGGKVPNNHEGEDETHNALPPPQAAHQNQPKLTKIHLSPPISTTVDQSPTKSTEVHQSPLTRPKSRKVNQFRPKSNHSFHPVTGPDLEGESGCGGDSGRQVGHELTRVAI